MSTGPRLHHRVRGRTGARGSVAMAMLVIVIVTGLIVALLATAEFATRGYATGDWRPAPGQPAELPALAACLTGT